MSKKNLLSVFIIILAFSGCARQKVKMRQADVPAGLANLLHLTANNIQVEDALAEEIGEGGEK